MTFLPKDYVQPKEEGSYYKFKKGENRFRILSEAVLGYEYWTRDNKPVRSVEQWSEAPENAKVDPETGRYQKHFWAFVVYNYEAKKAQIMEITQSTIMSGIEALTLNKKWGDPTGYDIAVNATGDGLEREYTVIAEPHSEAPQADTSKIDLQALFSGSDPFKAVSSNQPSEAPDPLNGDNPF